MLNTHSKAERRGDVPGLTGLRDSDLAALASVVDEVTVRPGNVLPEKSPSRQAFLITEGIAAVRVCPRMIAELGAGEHVGEIAVLTEAGRNARYDGCGGGVPRSGNHHLVAAQLSCRTLRP